MNNSMTYTLKSTRLQPTTQRPNQFVTTRRRYVSSSPKDTVGKGSGATSNTRHARTIVTTTNPESMPLLASMEKGTCTPREHVEQPLGEDAATGCAMERVHTGNSAHLHTMTARKERLGRSHAVQYVKGRSVSSGKLCLLTQRANT